MEKVIEKYINHFEALSRRPITPLELQEFQKDLSNLAKGDVKLADAIVEQSIAKNWKKIYKLQKPKEEPKVNQEEDKRNVWKDFNELLERQRQKREKWLSDFFGIEWEKRDKSLDAVKERYKRIREWSKAG